MSYNTKQIGAIIRETRKALDLTQEDVALVAGTGLRFIIDLEKGKPTCQLEKVLIVLNTLGIRIRLLPPAAVFIPQDISAQET